MAALVPIPWQPHYFLTPDTLTMLQLASAHAGHNINVNDAWRSYAEQKGYWDAYQNYLHGGPYAAIASNPDTGQRNHMRGAAVDIANRADRAAMLAVGFTPDGDEWWHFNNPRWASMPIIPTNTGSASSGATPLAEAAAPALNLSEAFVMIRIQSPARGIALVGPGYFRLLRNNEEVQNSDPLIVKHVNGNDRQFDLWRSMALDGNSAKAV